MANLSKEKQIEIPEDEKGVSGYSKLAWKLWQEVKLPMTQCETIDRVVREAGYRKQSEGEWIESDIPQEKYVCSLCGGACWYYDYQGDVAKSRFCPNCGSKMKGGAE